MRFVLRASVGASGLGRLLGFAAHQREAAGWPINAVAALERVFLCRPGRLEQLPKRVLAGGGQAWVVHQGVSQCTRALATGGGVLPGAAVGLELDLTQVGATWSWHIRGLSLQRRGDRDQDRGDQRQRGSHRY